MEHGGEPVLRSSSSRNFSRPFPSPMSTRYTLTPDLTIQRASGRASKHHDPFASLPASATMPTANTNSLIDFACFQSPLSTATNAINGTQSQAKLKAEQEAARIHFHRSTSDPLASSSFPSSSTAPRLDALLPGFRPHLWKSLDQRGKVLALDLFWPISTSRHGLHQDLETTDIFPVEDLRPLLTFRNLRSLKLVGMMQSYQPVIWAACWLNEDLWDLHLEMASPPTWNLASGYPQRAISYNWSIDHSCGPPPSVEYLGYHGQGILHEEFGDGEYLDSQAIKMARNEVAHTTHRENVRYLPIRRMTLMNFVVDGGAIARWFDPERLGEIVFKSGCVDAGFFIPEAMQEVIITTPKPPQICRWVRPGEVKLVELHKGQAVPEMEQSRAKTPTLRKKLSGMLPRMSTRQLRNRVNEVDEKTSEYHIVQL